MKQIAFSWHGLPQFAARLFRAASESIDEECVIIGSKPEVPVEGMEQILQQKVYWVDPKKEISWGDLGLDVPLIYFQSGWAYPAFSSLGREVRLNKGKVIVLSDANWRGDLRQLVAGAIVFRLFYKRYFNKMLVPGKQGLRLMKWFGFRNKDLHSGMLGADPNLFQSKVSLVNRAKIFLFVGQFIKRKQVVELAKAFINFAATNPDWRLHIIGGGVQKESIPKHPRIKVEDFVQPEALAEHFQRARFFVLPSIKEAWGVVVHEATLSGCALILSNAIGSIDDLTSTHNSLIFRAGSQIDLERALFQASNFNDEMLRAAQIESIYLASQFGPRRFSDEVKSIINEYKG